MEQAGLQNHEEIEFAHKSSQQLILSAIADGESMIKRLISWTNLRHSVTLHQHDEKKRQISPLKIQFPVNGSQRSIAK